MLKNFWGRKNEVPGFNFFETPDHSIKNLSSHLSAIFWNDQRYSNSSGLSLPTSLFALELAKMSCFEVFEIQVVNK